MIKVICLRPFTVSANKRCAKNETEEQKVKNKKSNETNSKRAPSTWLWKRFDLWASVKRKSSNEWQVPVDRFVQKLVQCALCLRKTNAFVSIDRVGVDQSWRLSRIGQINVNDFNFLPWISIKLRNVIFWWMRRLLLRLVIQFYCSLQIWLHWQDSFGSYAANVAGLTWVESGNKNSSNWPPPDRSDQKPMKWLSSCCYFTVLRKFASDCRTLSSNRH